MTTKRKLPNRVTPSNVFFLDDQMERDLCLTCTLSECKDTSSECAIVIEGHRRRTERRAQRAARAAKRNGMVPA